MEAVATNADGQVGRNTTVLKVRDPDDAAAPQVQISVPAAGAKVTGPVDVTATVADVNLDFWKLELAPVGGALVTLAEGTAPVAGGVLTRLDPGLLANGFYRLRLSAQDITGRVIQAGVGRIGLCEGWRRGTEVPQVDDPVEAGRLLREMLPKVRRNSGMDGMELD